MSGVAGRVMSPIDEAVTDGMTAVCNATTPSQVGP